MLISHRSIILMVTLALFGSCSVATETADSPSVPSTLAFGNTTTTLITPPTEFFEGPEADLISFQSSWVCEFQRRTFATPEAGVEALEEALREANIDQATYDAFLGRMAENQALRDAILFEYQETCRR